MLPLVDQFERRLPPYVGRTIIIVVTLTVMFFVYRYAFPGMDPRQGDRDAIRTDDLRGLSADVENYRQVNGAYPRRLSDVRSYSVDTDPKNGKPYEYHLLDTNKFEICANFETDTEDKYGRNASFAMADLYLDPWGHAPVRTCYQFTSDSKAPTKSAEQHKVDDRKRIFRTIIQWFLNPKNHPNLE
jgi:hypothetical protein